MKPTPNKELFMITGLGGSTIWSSDINNLLPSTATWSA
jgi:hypothetical protein